MTDVPVVTYVRATRVERRPTLRQRLRRPRAIDEADPLTRTVSYILASIGAFCLVTPFLFVVAASVRDDAALFRTIGDVFPSHLYFGNYRHLLADTDFLRWMLNTLVVASIVVLLKLVIDSMAAYAFAKLPFRGKRLAFALILITLMVPYGAIIVPLWAIAHDLGITNTYQGLILPALASPLGVFLLRAFMQNLPRELEDAGRLDGMSELRIYSQVVLPLLKPALVVLAVMLFTEQYLGLLWPLVAASRSDLQLVTVGLAKMRASQHVNYGLWSAGSVMAMVPIGIVFLLLQRQFLARSIAGALKQ